MDRQQGSLSHADGAGRRRGTYHSCSGRKEFGEDKRIDELIRKYGYRGTPATLDAVEKNADLAGELSAAAHLIHALVAREGSRITWCPGKLTREEIEGVGFAYGELGAMLSKYDPAKLHQGITGWMGKISSLLRTRHWGCGRMGHG